MFIDLSGTSAASVPYAFISMILSFEFFKIRVMNFRYRSKMTLTLIILNDHYCSTYFLWNEKTKLAFQTKFLLPVISVLIVLLMIAETESGKFFLATVKV